MDLEQKEALARTGDTSGTAIGLRLRAGRISAGFPKQKDFAKTAGVSATTYNSQEKRGAPSIEVMRLLYRAHRIDFNFILHGDFSQLPADVQAELFLALSEL